MSQELTKRRSLVANNFFQECPLPKGIEVETFSGFEQSSDSDICKGTAYVYFDDDSVSVSSKKLEIVIGFIPETTIIESARLGQYDLKILPKYGASSLNKEERRQVLHRLDQALNSLELVGETLDLNMEDGKYHSESYRNSAKLINLAINSIEEIKKLHQR